MTPQEWLTAHLTSLDYTDECIIWPFAKNSEGYPRIGQRLVTRIVAEHVLGEPLSIEDIICHDCDTPACVNPAHLWVGAHVDNVRDKVRKGRQARGAGNGRAKLTIEQVAAVLTNAEQESRAALARRYGVTPRPIYAIQQGHTWRSV